MNSEVELCIVLEANKIELAHIYSGEVSFLISTTDTVVEFSFQDNPMGAGNGHFFELQDNLIQVVNTTVYTTTMFNIQC